MPAGVAYEPTPCRIASQAFTAPRPEIARPLSHEGRYSLDFLRPIGTAEALEAVDWLADLPQQTWPQAGRSSDASF